MDSWSSAFNPTNARGFLSEFYQVRAVSGLGFRCSSQSSSARDSGVRTPGKGSHEGMPGTTISDGPGLQTPAPNGGVEIEGCSGVWVESKLFRIRQHRALELKKSQS